MSEFNKYKQIGENLTNSVFILAEGKRLAARNRRRKILPCPQCDHVASHVDSLKCHIKSVHEGIRYQCDQCAHAATSVGNLNKHKKRMHMNKDNTNDQPEKPLEQVKESSLSGLH